MTSHRYKKNKNRGEKNQQKSPTFLNLNIFLNLPNFLNHHLSITPSASDLSPKSFGCTSISSQSDCNFIARNTQQQPTSNMIRLSYCTTSHERAVTNARRGNVHLPFSCRPHIISMLILHLLSKIQYKTSK